MATIGSYTLLATKLSQLSNALVGSEGLHAIRGYRKL